MQPIFDGADAFVGWCNAAGGINGRKLVLDKRDSALSNYLPQIQKSCTADLAIVSMGILDDTGVDAWQKCGLLNFTAATVGAKAANAKLMYPMTPIPANQQTIGGFHLFFDQHPDWAQAVGSLYSNGVAGDREQHTYNEAITSIGGKIVYTAEYTPTTSNWTPFVQSMKKAGVKFLFLNDTANVTAGIEQAMATLGWYPDMQISPSQVYDSDTLTLAGKNIKNYYVYIPTTPFEAADSVPAVKQYLDLLNQYAPKAKKTFFGSTSFSAWLLLAEGIKPAATTSAGRASRSTSRRRRSGQVAVCKARSTRPPTPRASASQSCKLCRTSSCRPTPASWASTTARRRTRRRSSPDLDLRQRLRRAPWYSAAPPGRSSQACTTRTTQLHRHG